MNQKQKGNLGAHRVPKGAVWVGVSDDFPSVSVSWTWCWFIHLFASQEENELLLLKQSCLFQLGSKIHSVHSHECVRRIAGSAVYVWKQLPTPEGQHCISRKFQLENRRSCQVGFTASSKFLCPQQGQGGVLKYLRTGGKREGAVPSIPGVFQ